MKFLEGVAPTVMVRVLFISILHIPIFLILSKLPGMNFPGLKDASISKPKTGIIQNLKSRKQYLEELQAETFGSIK